MERLRIFIVRMLGGHFASIEPGFALVAGCVLVFFHWFAVQTHHMAGAILKGAGWWECLVLAPFVVTFGLLLYYAPWAAGSAVGVVEQRNPENQYEGLIVFLSPAKKEDLAKRTEIGGSIADGNVRARFEGPWRMPVEAIHHQLKTLRQVLVIPSLQTQGEYESFRKTVQPLIKAAGSSAEIGVLQGHRWQKGVAMDDARETADAIQAAYGQLIKDVRIPSQHILIDVTGGFGLVTAAATAVATARKSRFAWINRNNYSVQAYQFILARGSDQ